MAKTRRRAYPRDGRALEDPKYGKRGTARGKSTSGRNAGVHNQKPNRPR